ncbi:hypothetical protein GF325_12100 [Candidatus Bathyarchaeota archaeon]|nr:hypothetical protein [Candidatus Bathyarchaeota archaeon]
MITMAESDKEEIDRIKHEKMKNLMKGNKKARIPAGPLHVGSVEQFKEILEKYHDIPIIADFWAEWCGPCRMLAPVFEKVASELEGQALFIKINTEQLPRLARYFQVSSIPLVLMIHENEVRASWIGLRQADFYLNSIKEYLAVS